MEVERAAPRRRNRGKLYSLTEETLWEDKGTGYVSISGQADSRRLIFQDEETGEVLHDRKVWPSDSYQLQGEGERQSIIVWEDPESQQDWALSFQEPADLVGIWDEISSEKRLLPLPTLGSLAELSRALTCVPPSQREALASECVKEHFLSGLVDAFHTAEDLGEEELLTSLWRIAKGIFLLANQKLAERYLRQDVYQDILGMLEYDEGLPPDRRIAHRQVHSLQVRFNQVVSLEDPEMLERIHLIYRLQYVKDIVLPRLLDDATFASMTQMVHANLAVVLEHLQTSGTLLEALFARLSEGDKQSLLFLLDACRLSRQVAPSQRQAMYERMVAHGLFATLVPFLEEGSAGPSEGSPPDRAHEAEGGEREATPGPPRRTRHLAVEVLLLCAQSDAGPLRRHLTGGGAGGRELLSLLIHVLHAEADQGVQTQIAELLKLVMDPSGLEGEAREECLGVFYDHGALDELVAPLRSRAARPRSEAPAAFGVQLACELLAFAVTHHGFRAKGYFTRGGFAEPLGRLLAAQQRFLRLAPVRLLRVLVTTMDDLYHRYLVRSGLLGPVMRSFQQSLQPPALGGGLFVSAVLGLLEFIRTENVLVLVDHICRRHDAMLQELAPRFKTLQNLLLTHRKNLESQALPAAVQSAADPTAEPAKLSAPAASGGSRKEAEEDPEGPEQASVDPYQDEPQREEEDGKAVPEDSLAQHTPRAEAPPGVEPTRKAENADGGPLLGEPTICTGGAQDEAQDVAVADASTSEGAAAAAAALGGASAAAAGGSVGEGDAHSATSTAAAGGGTPRAAGGGAGGAAGGHAAKRAGHAAMGRAFRSKGKGRGRPRLAEVAACPTPAGAHAAEQGTCARKLLLSHAPKRLRTSSPPVVAS